MEDNWVSLYLDAEILSQIEYEKLQEEINNSFMEIASLISFLYVRMGEVVNLTTAEIAGLNQLKTEILLKVDALMYKYKAMFSLYAEPIYLDSYTKSVNLLQGRVSELSTSSDFIRNLSLEDWVGDGLNWMNRIDIQHIKLRSGIITSLENSVIANRTASETLIDVAGEMNRAGNRAKTLYKTEQSYLTNKALLNSFADNNVDEYMYNAILDRKTSSICRTLDGNVFPISEAVVGLNMPPMHGNCRSFIVPII